MSGTDGKKACAKCGTECLPGDRFCIGCGMKLNEAPGALVLNKKGDMAREGAAPKPAPAVPLGDLAYSDRSPDIKTLPMMPRIPRVYTKPVPEKGFLRKFRWSGSLVTVDDKRQQVFLLVCCPGPLPDDAALKEAAEITGLAEVDVRMRLVPGGFTVLNRHTDKIALMEQAALLEPMGIKTVLFDNRELFEVPLMVVAKYAQVSEGGIAMRDEQDNLVMEVRPGDSVLLVKGHFEMTDIRKTNLFASGRNYGHAHLSTPLMASLYGGFMGYLAWAKTGRGQLPSGINYSKMKAVDIFNVTRNQCARVVEHIFSFKKTFGESHYGWSGFDRMIDTAIAASGDAVVDASFGNSSLPHSNPRYSRAERTTVEPLLFSFYLGGGVRKKQQRKIETNRFTNYSRFRYIVENQLARRGEDA